MGQAIGDVLILGVGVTLSPMGIVAVALMITGPNGRRSALAFVAGWAAGLTIVAILALVLAHGGDASSGGAPADWVSVLKVAAGALLLIVGVRQWRRQSGDEAAMPGWMRRVETLAPSRAAAVALPIAALKPKNLLLTIGAALSIAETGTDAGGEAVALAVFVALGTLGPAIPLGIYLLMPKRAGDLLPTLRGWLIRENTTIIAVICLLVAAKLIGDAIGALSL